MNKIFVVLVTYNRLGKLKTALKSYESQSVKPDGIIVVNNNSNDGTMEFLSMWEASSILTNHHVINSSQNLGGAGGFRLGMKKAIELGADWIWVADDDAYPDMEAFTILNKYIDDERFSDVACFCGAVYIGNSKTSIDTDHRRIEKNRIIKVPYKVPTQEYEKEYISIDESTYVGSCYKVTVLKKVGLTNQHLFIYFDDTEHSHRVHKEGRILLIPAIKIVHDTASYIPLEPNVIATWRDFYLLRNHIYILKHYHWLTCIVYSFSKWLKAFGDYLSNRNSQLLKMRLKAIHNGIIGKLGINPVYKPGYKIYK